MKKFIKDRILNSKYKDAFLRRFKNRDGLKLLDVGCGNNSPFYVKKQLPLVNYTGIDIGDYNQDKPNLADRYLITTPELFSEEIDKFNNCFDIVISAHNLEHCNHPIKTLESMINATKSGGGIFLSFPCARSVGFPQRKGTLNYYDDPLINLIHRAGMKLLIR